MASTAVVRVADLQAGTRVPRAELLERLRARKGVVHVREQELVRDVIYLLQGISGTCVRFQHEWQLPREDGTTRAQTVMRLEFDESRGLISPPTRDLIHRVAELGQLYLRVQRYVDEHTQPTPTHLTAQSLTHFLAQEMTAHCDLVSQMDAQWHAQEEGEPLRPPLTLQRLVQTTREPLLRMRLMSTMVESCREAHGGAMVSTIHTYTLTGDPFIRRCTSTLLDQVSRPFFHTLSRWIYDGELDDPFGEFFVACAAPAAHTPQPTDDLVVATEQSVDAAAVWQNRFVLRPEMLPTFLSEHFARKIFSTGKSLHFLRECCGADQGVHGRSRRELRYSDMAGLEHAIDAEFALASGHLCALYLTQFRLRDHLRALKSYLLLTQGDFADALLQTLGPSLARPASTLYQHNLSAALETAIRASHAQFDDPDLLRRLDARSLDFGPGDTGWDTFTLEYRVESPVNAVLDASAMAGYQLLFHYLWQLNRVSASVSSAWALLLATQKATMRSRHHKSLPPALRTLLATTLGRLSEMVHFVRQLQSFCELEGIAHAWQRLEHDLGTCASDLDQLIETHRRYLHTLIHTTLLRGRRGQGDHLADDVRAQLACVLAFATAASELSHHATAELARVASGVEPLRSAAHTEATLTERLHTEHAHFQHRMHTMMAALERHPTLTVRDLAVRCFANASAAGTLMCTIAESGRRQRHTERAQRVCCAGIEAHALPRRCAQLRHEARPLRADIGAVVTADLPQRRKHMGERTGRRGRHPPLHGRGRRLDTQIALEQLVQRKDGPGALALECPCPGRRSRHAVLATRAHAEARKAGEQRMIHVQRGGSAPRGRRDPVVQCVQGAGQVRCLGEHLDHHSVRRAVRHDPGREGGYAEHLLKRRASAGRRRAAECLRLQCVVHMLHRLGQRAPCRWWRQCDVRTERRVHDIDRAEAPRHEVAHARVDLREAPEPRVEGQANTPRQGRRRRRGAGCHVRPRRLKVLLGRCRTKGRGAQLVAQCARPRARRGQRAANAAGVHTPVPRHTAHERVQEQVVRHRVWEGRRGVRVRRRRDGRDGRLGSDKEVEQVLERAKRHVLAPPPRACEECIPQGRILEHLRELGEHERVGRRRAVQKGAVRTLHLLDHHEHAVHHVGRAWPHAHEDAQHAAELSARERGRILLRDLQEGVKRVRGAIGREGLVQRRQARTARLPGRQGFRRRHGMQRRSPRADMGEPAADRAHAAEHTGGAAPRAQRFSVWRCVSRDRARRPGRSAP